ncbi:hypothetical protein [Clostridium cibarium]|uniref:Uncharacterized protein n=1 Tax=Clostridium cibarium TaxID=2762247 RepID=A0ABR8PTE9_9CLOT|nr:hypothetical protein [Clostridium cibarium]MBD7911422.1 hypothetical protein [Clostridium cibarium]
MRNNSYNIFKSAQNTLDRLALRKDNLGNYSIGFSKSPVSNQNKIDVKTDSSIISTPEVSPINDNISFEKKVAPISENEGIIDSIANEITPVRLQQAIILSEIVGKPRSKTRRKRRF